VGRPDSTRILDLKAFDPTGLRPPRNFNHYHMLLETPEANLVTGMKWMQGTFTQRINGKRKQRGHLFQGRYKAIVIDPEDGSYFTSVGNYIHLNPVRAGLIGDPPDTLRQYRWSSYPSYLVRPKRRPPWLVVWRLMNSCGCQDRARDRKRFERLTEEKILEWRSRAGRRALNKEWRKIRRGWFLGDEGFRDSLMEFMEKVLEGKRRESFSGEGPVIHGEKEAERWLERGMEVLRLDESDLPDMKKGAPEKAAIAWLIRKRTTAGNRWIAENLEMGHPGNIPKIVRRTREARSGPLYKFRRRLEK
jgi:putative transposase